ncbi:MAG: winged helix-turn-helix domain-containing protein, partial [Acidobacteriaceae bacterium]|nr:winged helix-turn-helix domain-containing protein [Acidobacteriaceae bacterium]
MRDDTQRRLTPALPDARDPRVSPVAGLVYRFEGVEVSSSRGSVTRNGEEHHIRQQSFQVLLHLLHERERLVTKEELIEKFWEHTAVTDNALVQCIADIRKVLGDDSRQPRFIRTIPKVGYRFVAAVEVERPEVPHSAPKEPAQTAAFRPGVIHENPLGRAAAALKNGRIPFYMTLIGLTAILVVSVAVHYSWARSSEVTLQPISGEKPIAVMYFENQSKRTDLNWLREGLTD